MVSRYDNEVKGKCDTSEHSFALQYAVCALQHTVHVGVYKILNGEHRAKSKICLKRINKCKHGPIDGILSGHGGKLGTYYPDLELGTRFWLQITSCRARYVKT